MGVKAAQEINQQQKAIFLFSYGRHATHKDFENAKLACEKFNPQVYSMECNDLELRERKDLFQNLNRFNCMARDNSYYKETYMSLMESNMETQQILGYIPFSVPQARYIIESGLNLIAFPIEGHTDRFFQKHIEYSHIEMHNAHKLLFSGNFDGALKASFISDTQLAAGYSLKENQIVENCKTYLADLSDAFPELKNLHEIRIYAQFGHMHIGITDRARAIFVENPNVQILHGENLPDGFTPSESCQLKIMAKSEASDDDTARSLLDSLLCTHQGSMLDVLNPDVLPSRMRDLVNGLGISDVLELTRKGSIILLFAQDAFNAWLSGIYDKVSALAERQDSQ